MFVFSCRTNTEVVAAEGGRVVFLTVSRSSGLESAVSVEWETQSNTASASGQCVFILLAYWLNVVYVTTITSES